MMMISEWLPSCDGITRHCRAMTTIMSKEITIIMIK